MDQSSVTVLFLAAEARGPTREMVRWLMTCERTGHFTLTTASFLLLLCKMDADVPDKGDAGCELTLSTDCRIWT